MTADVQTALRSPRSYDAGAQGARGHGGQPGLADGPQLRALGALRRREAGPLAQEIDRLLAAGEPITETRRRGAGRPVPARGQAQRRDPATPATSCRKELQSVTPAIETAQQSSEEYGQELATASETPGRRRRRCGEGRGRRPDRRHPQGAGREPPCWRSQLAETTAELGRLRENLDQVRRDAMTDGLTNLANRKAFDEEPGGGLRPRPTPSGAAV